MPVAAVWSSFKNIALLNDSKVSFGFSQARPKLLTPKEVKKILDKTYFPYFEVEAKDFSFQYGQNGGNNYDHLFIEGSSSLLTIEFCDELISKSIAHDENFVQAHLVDKNYQSLQNMSDPLIFKELGLSTNGLPMKSNGLPFPLEQQIVDTSRNPGRYALKQGYVEVSAAAMWFGDAFWEKVNNTAQDTIDLLPHEVKLEKEICWKLTVNTGLFTDQATAELQNKIRYALFPLSRTDF
jgi:hypothetical protein